MRAAFRFVHVMGGDKERHPLPREFEEQVPKFPPRDRIDPGRRFIEKKDGRFDA